MIVKTNGMIRFEEGEPALRSCPECNPAHEHLRDVKFVHWCFQCNRYWINGRYLDTRADLDKFIEFMRECEVGGCAIKVIDVEKGG